MKILLMCKGPSVKLLNQKEFITSDIIAWANIPVIENSSLEIPNKVDILYIREKSFYEDLTIEKRDEINKLNIKEIVSVKNNFKSIGKHNVSRNINYDSNVSFNASTGLSAFIDLIDKNPTELTVAGLDLFQKGLPLYFFDFKYILTGNKNKENLKKEFLDKDMSILKKSLHNPEESIDVIYNKVLKSTNIFFTFYTTNKKLGEKLKPLKNVKIITQ